MALIRFIVLALLSIVVAGLSPNYPVNAQIPPVARASKPFEFVFSQGTFAYSDADTKYSLVGAPSWLQVDSASRTLSGTPQSRDAGYAKFSLVASDSSGSANMDVTLFVSTEEGPKPGKPLLPQLEKIGATSAPSTILMHTGDSFSIPFDHDTFTNTSSSTVYYGTSPENSPLPSWMRFDQSTLTFTGTSPMSGPLTFSFHLIASDVPGFSAATMSFDMTIAPHVLAFNQSLQTFQLSKGQKFTSPNFRNMLTLDENELPGSIISSVDIDSPGWLTLDSTTISVSGTPPDNAVNQNATISVTDTYHNVANLIIMMEYSELFAKDFKDCNANIGEDFMCVFNTSVLTDDSVQLKVDLGQPVASWAHYNANNKTLYGHIPKGTDAKKVSIDLTASKGSATETKKFTIDVAEAGHHLASGNGSGSSAIHEKRAGIIAISVIIPFVFLTSIALFLCCARRKRQPLPGSGEEGKNPKEKSPFSGPGAAPNFRHSQRFEHTIPGALPETACSPPPTSKPPKLELGPLWNSDSFERRDTVDRNGGVDIIEEDKENSFSQSAMDWGFSPLKSTDADEEKQTTDPPPQSKRLSFQSSPPVRRRPSKKREPLKPIQARRSLKRNSSSKSKRHSKRSSGISSVASGLPVRLSGAGHGAGGFGPPGHGVVQMSWQNTQASLQSEESDLGNLTPLFPRPPPRARESMSKRVSLRAVETDAISESDSLEAFVYGRAKSRNSSNPLFSGQGNRRRSSALRALERARSTQSRAESISMCTDDFFHRQSIMSGSVYTEDNRQSTNFRPFSEVSNLPPPVAPFTTLSKGPSQSSLAQNYSAAISPLPRFFSEASMGSARRMEPGEVPGGPEVYSSVLHSLQHHAGHGRWYPETAYPQQAYRQGSLRKSSSLSSMAMDGGKGRQVSLVRFAGKENSPMSDFSEHRWRLGENQDRRPVSIESPDRLQRDLTGSVRGDMAFV